MTFAEFSADLDFKDLESANDSVDQRKRILHSQLKISCFGWGQPHDHDAHYEKIL